MLVDVCHQQSGKEKALGPDPLAQRRKEMFALGVEVGKGHFLDLRHTEADSFFLILLGVGPDNFVRTHGLQG